MLSLTTVDITAGVTLILAAFVRILVSSQVITTDIDDWRWFLRCFITLLVCGRILTWIVSHVGAAFASKISSRFTSLFVSPVEGKKHGNLRAAAAKFIMKKRLDSGGDSRVDDQVLNMLTQEADGLTSVVWIFAAAFLAAKWAGLTISCWTNVAVALVTWRVVVIIKAFADIFCHAWLSTQTISTDNNAIKMMLRAFKILLTATGVLFVISNLGWDVSSMYTGIGLSGLLTIAASQAWIKDMSSWAWLVHQVPFVVGDCVSVCGCPLGIVTKLDYQSTWVRVWNGETLIMPNAKVVDNTIENHSSVQSRRLSLCFEISALTPPDKLEAIPGLVRAIVDERDQCDYFVCWLQEATDWGFKFELLWWSTVGDMNVARESNTALWVKILKELKEHDIELASAERLRRKGKIS